jgi:hypothetical protein
MSRGAYDSTCDIFYGSNSPYGPPGVQYAAGVPCRLVPQDQILQIQFPFNLTGAWLTIDAVTPNGLQSISPWLGAVFDDYYGADVVIVSADAGVQYVVCRQEYVQPFGSPGYYRHLLLRLSDVVIPPWLPQSPLPPAPTPVPAPQPGFSCSTAGVLGAWSAGVSLDLSGADTWWQLRGPAGYTGVVYVVGGDPTMFTEAYQFDCSSLSPINSMTGPGSMAVTYDTAGSVYVKVVSGGSPARYGIMSGP